VTWPGVTPPDEAPVATSDQVPVPVTVAEAPKAVQPLQVVLVMLPIVAGVVKLPVLMLPLAVASVQWIVMLPDDSVEVVEEEVKLGPPETVTVAAAAGPMPMPMAAAAAAPVMAAFLMMLFMVSSHRFKDARIPTIPSDDVHRRKWFAKPRL
jgi:hypothetical protein